MRPLMDSTDRRPLDYFSVCLIVAGALLEAAGVVTMSVGVHVLGFIVLWFGLIYFILTSWDD
jgi:hypothetical protein